MKHFKTLLMLSAVLVTTQLAGCAALLVGGAAGAGSVVYVKGQLHEDVKASVSRVHEASVSTLRELKLPIIEDNHDSLSAKIKSRFADGSDVWIQIESLAAESSKITIRVGILGDEYKSRQILDGIHKYLPGAGRKT
jgi:hypothetical protein